MAFTLEAIGHGYVKHYEDTPCGRGNVTFTDSAADAITFTTKEAAAMFWMTQSATVPLREDGKPNRPLTAFNVVIKEVSKREMH